MRKVLNKTGISQIVYDWKQDPIEIPNNCVFFTRQRSIFSSLDSLAPLLLRARRLLLIRRFALGDILMLFPVCRELRKFYGVSHITLATTTMLAESPVLDMLNDGAVDRIISTDLLDRISYDVACHLDGWLELDHLKEPFKRKHRVDLYREFFELPTNAMPDWGTLEKEVSARYLVFCSGGRRLYNSLSPTVAKAIEAKLSKRKKVVLLSDTNRVPDSDLVSIIGGAAALVTVDSAPLWIAHYTATPIVFLSGPTRPEERVIYHPLYPDGVETVMLAEKIGCEACFERAVDCQFTAACMRNDREAGEIAREVWEKVERVRWKKR